MPGGRCSEASTTTEASRAGILDRQLFDTVQAKLSEQATNQTDKRTASEALLAGRIFDDRGNRMTPTFSRKAGRKYRYYLSSALLQGRSEAAGSAARVPAVEIETAILEAARKHLKASEPIGDQDLIEQHVERVEVQSEQMVLKLIAPHAEGGGEASPAQILQIPWRKEPMMRRREILVPSGSEPRGLRPIRSETRATLVASIVRGRRWLDELISDASASTQAIAEREGAACGKST